MKKRDLVWLSITFLIAIATCLVIYTPDGVNDINIHDTYFVIANLHLWFLCISLIFFLSYLIRSFIFGYKSKTSNIILITSNILVLLSMVLIIQFMFNRVIFNNTIDATPMDEPWRLAYYISLGVFVIFQFILAYSSYKLGKNFKGFNE